ncbi:MAG: JAB domain-containing protein [Pedobacter sp.]
MFQTMKLKKAAKLLDVELYDHLIIMEKGILSLTDKVNRGNTPGKLLRVYTSLKRKKAHIAVSFCLVAGSRIELPTSGL